MAGASTAPWISGILSAGENSYLGLENSVTWRPAGHLAARSAKGMLVVPLRLFKYSPSSLETMKPCKSGISVAHGARQFFLKALHIRYANRMIFPQIFS
jgi:hypothetical protein